MSQPPLKKARLEAASGQIRKVLEKSQQNMEVEVREILNQTVGVSPSGPSKSLEADMNIIERMKNLQESKRRSRFSRGRPQEKPKPKSLPVSICRMASSRGQARKKGEYVELRLWASDSYADVVEKAQEAIDVDGSDDEEGQVLPLWRLNGSRILDTPIDTDDGHRVPWTIGGYLSQAYKKSVHSKLGIGYTYEIEETKRAMGEFRENLTSGFMLNIATKERKKLSAKQRSKVVAACENNTIEVKYSPYIGTQGLDVTKCVRREEAFLELYPNSAGDIDYPLPWYPETADYKVCEIYRGHDCLLEWRAAGGYFVKDDLADGFAVTQQSPSMVYKSQSESTIPIFCVASSHHFDFNYTWNKGGFHVGTNSPVYYSSTSGIYKCTVTDHMLNQNCCSHAIQVAEGPDRGSGVPSHPISVSSKSENSSPPHSTPLLTNQPLNQTEQKQWASSVREFGEDLEKATDGFNETTHLVETGGFGKVLKGNYHHCPIAVKLLLEDGVRALGLDAGSLMHSEIMAVSKFRHPNLVSLMGYCTKPAALVYPFIERGSLFDNLYKWKVLNPLKWEERLTILRDTARGMAYLHSEDPPMVHHDIKSPNILLDMGLNAQLADVGFAMPMPEQIGET